MAENFADYLVASVDGPCLRVVFSDVDFSVRVLLPKSEARYMVQLRATFRDPSDSGGTWWQSWESVCHCVSEERFLGFLVNEIMSRRAHFQRLLCDHQRSGAMPAS